MTQRFDSCNPTSVFHSVCVVTSYTDITVVITILQMGIIFVFVFVSTAAELMETHKRSFSFCTEIASIADS